MTPSTNSAFSSILGDTLISSRGRFATNEALHGKRVVGLYFMASVCDRCHLFTPALATVYRNMHLKLYRDLSMRSELEIVVVSVDTNPVLFRDFLHQTPFLALPLQRRDLAHALLRRYKVQRMPSLVFVDENASVVERNGRALVDDNFMDIKTIWASLKSRALVVR